MVLVLACGETQQPAMVQGEPAASPPAENPLREAYFGDLHVHTTYSLDSYSFANELGPRDAYRFARGGEVTLVGGATQRLRRPLDFAAVTDHAETLVEFARCVQGAGEEEIFESEFCTAIRTRDSHLMTRLRKQIDPDDPQHLADVCPEGPACREASAGPWREIRAAAEEFYEPGVFTTFNGWEYSPPVADGGMLHRNVVFRGTEVPELALGFFDLPTAERLWSWLEEECRGSCEVLTIPHNSNFSWGLTFATGSADGSPIPDEVWRRRAALEPLVEITQHKGSSECALGLGTTDEECSFEQLFDPCSGSLATDVAAGVRSVDRDTACAAQGAYVRDALATGLRLEEESGLNPFKLGFIGSTDTQNSSPGAVAEDDFKGHHGTVDDSPADRFSPQMRPADTGALLGERAGNALYNPGGLAAVWAEANTRESIFDALRRRETFATSGPRLRVRLFAGWDFPPDLHREADAVARAYEGGVPMGGDLVAADGDGPPRFLVVALKDAGGADLDRVEMVKVWNESGVKRERIWDLVCSGGRAPDARSGRCPATGAGVDLSDCSPTGGAGAAELATVWSDPEFDPAARSLYYVRVYENPTCRWSTWESLRSGLPAPDNVPATIQERAWSSPIWYTPAGTTARR